MLAWNSAKANSFSKNYIPSDLHHLKSDKDFEEGIYNQHLKVLWPFSIYDKSAWQYHQRRSTNAIHGDCTSFVLVRVNYVSRSRNEKWGSGTVPMRLHWTFSLVSPTVLQWQSMLLGFISLIKAPRFSDLLMEFTFLSQLFWTFPSQMWTLTTVVILIQYLCQLPDQTLWSKRKEKLAKIAIVSNVIRDLVWWKLFGST